MSRLFKSIFFSIATISFIVSSHFSAVHAQKTKGDNALLWKVTGKNLKKPSYVFGTIHIIDAKDYFLPVGTLSAMESSDRICFEIDMAEMSDMSSMMGMMQKIYMEDGLSIKDLLSESDYKLVSDHFSKQGLPMFFMEKMKPMFLTVFASGDINPMSLDKGTMKSYEMEFYSLAKSMNKLTGGLETIDFQISLFDEIPYDAQAKMLVEAVKAGDSDKNGEFSMMVESYKAQDIEKLASMISSSESSISGFEDALLFKRNSSWIPLMEAQMEKEPTFFAVGAGHLGGEKGVIRLLRKTGYKVRPVSD
jgi:uncharacterized protein YbaP (TraB family)